MVTFTLTPTNAESIPDNVVHLIVAKGVTEIPEQSMLLPVVTTYLNRCYLLTNHVFGRLTIVLFMVVIHFNP